MSYTLTINGSAVGAIIDSVDLARVINGQDTLVLEIPSADGSYVPSLQDPVILEVGSTRVFGGLIEKVEEAGLGDEGGVPLKVRLECVSNEVFATRRYATESVPAGTLKSFLVVIATYLAGYGITLDAAQVNGPTLAARTIDTLRIDEWLNQLSAETNYIWEIDPYKVLRMTLPGTVAAPHNIVSGDGHAIGDVVITRTRAQYANRIIGQFGPTDVIDRPQDYVGDGVTTTFDSKYLIHGPLPYDINAVIGYGVIDTIGWGSGSESLGGTSSPSGVIWEYDPTATPFPTIKRRTGAVANGNAFRLRAQVQFPIQVISEDLADQAINGIYELRISDENVIDYDVAKGITDAALSKGTAITVTAVYKTQLSDLAPGQTQTINVSSTRHTNSTFTITEVRMSMDIEGQMWFTVRAIEGDAFKGSFRDTYTQWAKYSTGGSTFSSSNPSIVPAGSLGDVQINGGSLLTADTGRFTYDVSTHTLTLDKLTSRSVNNLVIQAGTSVSPTRADVTITGGQSTNWHGGKVTIKGGSTSVSGGVSGDVELFGGDSLTSGSSQQAGSILIKTGTPRFTSGTITITTGAIPDGSASLGTLITISVATPASNTGGSGVGVTGGGILIQAGPGQPDSFSALGNGTGGNGGVLDLFAGDGGAETVAGNTRTGGNGGKVRIRAGNGGNAPGSGGTTNNGGNGADIELQPGAGGTGSSANGTGGGVKVISSYVELEELSAAPAAPAANKVRIYAIDNGAGKTQLMSIFSSGAAQQLSIQP